MTLHEYARVENSKTARIRGDDDADNPQSSPPSIDPAGSDGDEPLPLVGDLKRMWAIGGPSTGTYLLEFCITLVTLSNVGNINEGAFLGAAALALSWINATVMIPLSCASIVGTLGSQAYGAGAVRRLSFTLYRGLLVSTALCVPTIAMRMFPGPFLALFGPHGTAAADATRFLRIAGPAVLPLSWTGCLQAFLASQEVLRPALATNVLLLGLHALLSLGLAHGRFGLPALGFDGAAIALIATRCIGPLLLCALTFLPTPIRERRPTIVAPARIVVRRAKLLEFVTLTVPTMLTTAAEGIGFEISTILAGHVSTRAMAAQSVITNVYVAAWLAFFGVDVATQVSVGTDLGSGAPRRARAVARRAVGITLFGAGFVAGIAVLLRRPLIGLFSGSADVTDTAVAGLPFAAVALLCDVTVAVLNGGVLMGIGRPAVSAATTIVAYYVLALPFGYLLGVHFRLGLAGIWIALIGSMAATAGVLVAFAFCWVDWDAESRRAVAMAQEAHHPKAHTALLAAGKPALPRTGPGPDEALSGVV